MLKVVRRDAEEAITHDLRLRDDVIGLDERYLNGWKDFHEIYLALRCL
jgi:hypothetical protein